MSAQNHATDYSRNYVLCHDHSLTNSSTLSERNSDLSRKAYLAPHCIFSHCLTDKKHTKTARTYLLTLGSKVHNVTVNVGTRMNGRRTRSGTSMLANATSEIKSNGI